MISRRNFVKNSGILPFLGFTDLSALSPDKPLNSLNKNPLIKSISLIKTSGTFNRFVSMNSYDAAPKGITGTSTFVKLTLDDGTIGIGGIGYAKPTDTILAKIRELIGKDPLNFYNWNEKEVISGIHPAMQPFFLNPVYSWIESALLDAIGKLKNKPVWQLMGTSVREGIDPYDGTVYFEDIAHNTDVRIIAESGKRISEEGYRAIKIKLGRPFKWLPGEAGLQRDIDAFIALREAVGTNFLLMADANNGYKNQYNQALKLLKATIPYDLFFMEELFPDDAALYKKMQTELMEAGLHVKIAEGEDIRDLSKFDSYMQQPVYNYIQPDMQTCGLSNILQTARKAMMFPHLKLIPHVWQSQFGLIMSMHAAKVQWNIPFVEDARYFDHAINTGAYSFKAGQWWIPEKPGWGIEFVPQLNNYTIDKEIVIT